MRVWMWRRWALKLVALVYTKYRPETGLDWDWARLRDKYFAGNEISPHYLYPVSVCCVIIQGRGKNKKRYICVGRSHQKSGETSLEPFGRAGTERYCPFLRSFSISLMEFSWSCLVSYNFFNVPMFFQIFRRSQLVPILITNVPHPSFYEPIVNICIPDS